MHFAFPPRKTSNPPPYAVRPSRSTPMLRRNQLRLLAIIALGLLSFIFIASRLFRSSSGSAQSEYIPPGTPPVVIVTVLDPKGNPSFNEMVKQNREHYAEKHGYTTFFPNPADYPLKTAPVSWAKVPAMRHAMTLFPHSTWYFFLDVHALIANPSISIEEHITAPARIEELEIVDVPVVPPDSVIKTYALKGDKVDLIICQDHEGIGRESFLIRRGEWAKYFLDAWFDPLYRAYNFQKAELHALEHIVQWHGTMLAKLVLVPQRIINSFHSDRAGVSEANIYQEGDFIINFTGCDQGGKTCETVMRQYAT
ncbi:galactosyl transferase GMA12/MNN10 family-domain-containing protein [Lineolata rhizophorae]|uniref:Galactosyl transferase GMA12/MNN10 family-domain-containing protein n=1 Tax=Lineolata rhizophorae TaxID=578093 RepID=A0A6A6P931_9PEZI|nr:galactosyl transferase GMA12/MNN10 family-domain-containing protein [Lineolata rhizophorae]